MEQSADDLRTEQYEPPDQVQSNVLPSFSVHTPDPFLSPAPLVADDVESSLEVCHCIVALSIIFESRIIKIFLRKEISTKLKGSIFVKKIEMRSEEAFGLNGDCEL